MMEHDTDRLFWAVAVIIIAALLLTIGIKTFPVAFQAAMTPISGVLKQSDTVTTAAKKAASDAQNSSWSISDTSAVTDPDASKKANAKTDDELNLNIEDNGDGTGNVMGFKNYHKFDGNTLTIPEYAKVNGHVVKLISIGDNVWNQNQGDGTDVELKDGSDFLFVGTFTPTLYRSDYSTPIEANDYNNLPDIIKNKYPNDQIVGIRQSDGNGVFANFPIHHLILSDSIKTIGWSAFGNCGIQSITWPKHLSTIYESAFYAGLNLPDNTFTLPNYVDNYSNIYGINNGPIDAFGANNISTLIIPKSTTFLPSQVITGPEFSPAYLQVVHVNKDFYNAHINDYFNSNSSSNIGITSSTQYVFDQN